MPTILYIDLSVYSSLSLYIYISFFLSFSLFLYRKNKTTFFFRRDIERLFYNLLWGRFGDVNQRKKQPTKTTQQPKFGLTDMWNTIMLLVLLLFFLIWYFYENGLFFKACFLSLYLGIFYLLLIFKLVYCLRFHILLEYFLYCCRLNICM